MRRAFGWAWKALVVVACLAFQYGMHASMRGAGDAALRAVLLWGPLALLAAWVLLRARRKLPWTGALLAAGAFVTLAEHAALGLAAVSGLSHGAGYLFLLWYFGRTLAPGREPLVTRFARSVHGALPPAMELFTRRVTLAWCAFFAGQLALSALLFAFAPLHAWSLFVNILNVPLLALMFFGQFAYRALRHPDYPRASPWQALQAFLREAPLSNGAEVR